MAMLRAATCSVLFIYFLSTLPNNIGGASFNSENDDGSFDNSEITLDTGVMMMSRKKRDLADLLQAAMMDMINYPFRLMSRLFASAYNLTWSILMAFINYITDNSSGPSLMDRFLMVMRERGSNMTYATWDFMKNFALPKMDEFIVSIKNTALLSDNIKSILSSIHSTYQMLHMLAIL